MVKSASEAPLVALSSGCIKRGAWLLPGALQASWSTVLGGILIVRDPLPTVADENPRGSRNVQTLDTEVPSKSSDTISHGPSGAGGGGGGVYALTSTSDHERKM